MKPILILAIGMVFSFWSYSQKRLKPPKAPTNIESVDKFVDAAFNIYNTTFDFHYGIPTENSLNASELEVAETANEGISDETVEKVQEGPSKDEFKIMEENIDQLLESVPDIIEEIDNHSVGKQLKATLNVNRALKALKESGKFVKLTFTGPQQ